MHGVLLLDKPRGISSNAALQKAKNLFRAKKAGHTGSLDPLATGMLPICFGEATKMSTYLLASDKSYRTTARLGVITDSGDSDGAVIETRELAQPFTRQQLEAELVKLRGPIEQVPPMYSALKHRGQRLYKLARQGIEVKRDARPVTIHDLHLESLQTDAVTLSVSCSKGTYIRTLVEDLGQALGCGAHITMLRRTSVDPYVGLPMLTLEELEKRQKSGETALDKCLLPLDSALDHLPGVTLDRTEAGFFRNGGRFPVERDRIDGPGLTALVLKVYAAAGFVGIAEIVETAETGAGKPLILQPKKVLNL